MGRERFCKIGPALAPPADVRYPAQHDPEAASNALVFAPRPVPAPVDATVPATTDDGTVIPFLDLWSNRQDVFLDEFAMSLTH